MEIYPNRCAAEELENGFSFGFRLKYTGPRRHIWSKNLISAEVNKEQTLTKILSEVKLGRMIGPFKKLPISTLRISPIGLVPKADGNWRLITHLSYPANDSVNLYIDPEFCKVNYSKFDDILEMVYECGPNAQMAKIDIKSAFRLLPVNPADFDLLGIEFADQIFIDKCLPFGCSISCKLFETLATFLQFMVEYRSGLHTIDHYLDDYFFVSPKESDDCICLMNTFKNLCQELAIPIAESKTMGPTNVLVFLGLIIDTTLMMVRIPEEKLQKLRLLLLPLLNKKKATVKNMQSLAGLLAFCSRAIPSSRAFIRRFYDLTAKFENKPHYLVRITSEVKEDIILWLSFLEDFNGQCFFPDRVWSSSDMLQLFTDSSGNPNLGCGCYFNGLWAQLHWPNEWEGSQIFKNMALLELIPVVLALVLWADKLKSKKILFHIDNLSLVNILSKRTSKDKQIMKLVRRLVLITMLNNIQFKPIHICTKNNSVADAISRFQMSRFRSLAPQAQIHPSPIPEEFLKIIMDL